MSYQNPLSGRVVGISISESPDMAVLGLSDEHLKDAMAEVARYLLSMGARLMYGGDFRPDGFTEVLFELVARYHRDARVDDESVGITNLFPWPVHIDLSADEVKQRCEDFSGVAELIFLTADGKAMSCDERQQLLPRQAAGDEWTPGLTVMREVMTGMIDARIILGGRVEGFKGGMPGVSEEALAALRAAQPLFLLGGFGGCARDIAADLGLVPAWPIRQLAWPGRATFASFSAESLNNGLSAAENATLATTVHIDQAVTLILRGLLRVNGGGATVIDPAPAPSL